MIHNFAVSLERANGYADADWWQAVYEQAFANLASMTCVRRDGWAQRGGIDRVLVLDSGKQLLVDEKVRMSDWDDFALEYWSDQERRVPGWVAKDLACDYIAYAFVPSQTCYLLPFQQLRAAWRRHYRHWVCDYRKVSARNEQGGRSWTTVSVAVPRDVLLSSITEALTVVWAQVETA